MFSASQEPHIDTHACTHTRHAHQHMQWDNRPPQIQFLSNLYQEGYNQRRRLPKYMQILPALYIKT